MNPYDFVRINWNDPVPRGPFSPHHRFEGLSGRLTGEIKTLTPLFLPDGNSTSPRRFLTNRQGAHIIPGSSLKGLIRSLVETIGPGCWLLFKGEHQSRLPRDFRPCERLENLCIACRMFGLINKGDLLLGHVSFEDAVCPDPTDYPALYTIILSSPKPRHTAFYLSNGQLAGRKFYFHHSSPPVDRNRWLPAGAEGAQRQNQYLKPIGPDSVFTFSAQFNNLSPEELRLLLYALVLEPGVHHKIGYAKPAGLGSVEIKLTRLEIVDYAQRYRSAAGGRSVYENSRLKSFVEAEIAPYTGDTNSNTLQDLRRIWAWPGRDDLQYPSWKDFQDYPRTPLDKMP